jgi:hypothetical protein
MRKMDPKEREAATRAPQAGDDRPAAMTAYHALKLADIVGEVECGREVAPEELRAVIGLSPGGRDGGHGRSVLSHATGDRRHLAAARRATAGTAADRRRAAQLG